jgi:hypothetical protein
MMPGDRGMWWEMPPYLSRLATSAFKASNYPGWMGFDLRMTSRLVACDPVKMIRLKPYLYQVVNKDRGM